jgi:hyperosmotically inducible protein
VAVGCCLLLATACASRVSRSSDDATITTRVKTMLLNDTEVNGSAIDVVTTNGVVTLSGRVASPRERERAVAIARGAAGVTDVQSKLQITG